MKRAHADLYEQYLNDYSSALAAEAHFVEKAKSLVDDMKRLSAHVTRFEDYEWLAGAAEKWRGVFVSTLNIPYDVSLDPPGADLTPPSPRPRKMVWGDADLERWVSDRALELAKDRALRRRDAMTAADLLRQMPSSPEEQQQDWTTASLLLACEILDGKTEFTQIRPRAYRRLEDCWLEDVKRLKAYFRWLSRGGMVSDGGAEDDWDSVCDEIQTKVLRAGPRAPAADFAPALDYLETRYLEGGKLDSAKAHDLIAAKARRLWAAGGNDPVQNWVRAADYTRVFYDNIVRAVCDSDPASIKLIIDALAPCVESDVAPGERYWRWHLMTNMFEVTLAIAFVDGALGLQPHRAAAA